jgi:biotin carboxyl carrier protein
VVRPSRVARKAGLRLGPILIYVAAVVAIAGGLFAWDLSYRRGQEEANKPPEPQVLVKNLVENIIGPDTVRNVRINEATGAVEVDFESATYPPRVRATADGEVLAQGLAAVGAAVKPGDTVVFVKGSGGQPVPAGEAQFAGRIVEVLVKPGDTLETDRPVVSVEPDFATVNPNVKTAARQNLETEGLLAFQSVIMQFQLATTVTSNIYYRETVIATVTGKRGDKDVTTTYFGALK